MASVFDINNPLLQTYLFYCSVLCLKVLLMAPLTAIQRIKNKAFANPEDASKMKVKPRVDENVERVRRAHLNDLENIPVFFVASFAYIMTNPSVACATMLFRLATLARIAHTLVYAVVVIPQPARGISWGVSYIITIYMAVQAIIHFIAHRNDLENIFVFFMASFGYILTNPSIEEATLLFRIVTGARILHTLVYAVVVVPQPARALAFFAALGPTAYMALRSATYFLL